MTNLELIITGEENDNGLFVCLKPKVPALITPTLVDNLRKLQDSLAEKYLSNSFDNYFYVVWYLDNYSNNSCKGLDYSFILNCLKNNLDSELEHYITRVFNLIFLNYIGLGLPIINCSIVNRRLTGISNDFFLLNNICFIYDVNVNDVYKIDIHKKFFKLVFEQNVYERNHYYGFRSMQIAKIRSVMEDIAYNIPSLEEINHLRIKFDMMQEKTISGIYDLASKNIKILERLARIKG